MRGRKRNTRLLSLLLCLAMLMALIPTSGLPVLGTAEETDISNEVYIVDEDITKRGEYEKHFLCSDGTYRAVSYAEPVHYYDSSTGTWQDNDVALTLNAASTRYEAQSGSFAVSFAKSYAAPNLSAAANGTTQSQATQTAQTVTMSNGIYPISWTTAVKPELSVAEGTAVQKSAALGAPRLLARTPAASILTSAEAEADAQQPFTGKLISDSGSFAAANRISVAEYGNIAQAAGQSTGVSLRYSVSQHKIKEDIVISNKSAVTDFVTTLDVGALTAVKQEDGSVLLVDEYGDTAYTVGVPFMYDADYNVSYNVAVTVEQTGSVCRITYAPDREWLNAAGRVYPVVLDPTVTSSEYYANIVDTYVTQADSNNHSGEGNLVVGIKSGKINRAYLKINNLPNLPDEVLPLSANLTIKHGANTTSGRSMSLYDVSNSWSVTTITYNNQPALNSFIDSCGFNTTNVSFDFNKSKINSLYNREANGTNYGFQIRYTSESTTNPDYNMLRSMEYPTASEQPLFTVSYGYSLPVELLTGTIYSFLNAGSNLYLDVCGGTDADNNNVAQYKGNSTVSQDFKLEKSSTGNGYILRAQVGSKTRVLDIYKTNGRVENGNNVQIYTNVDPKAQEWLILPVDADNFRIVPRSNMSLSLTSYGSANGTANGRTSTSAGNVFVSTYTGNNQNQWWRIERENGVFMDPGVAAIEDGEYYLNSRNTSKYLRNVSGNVQGANGLASSLGTSIKWKFTNMGGRYLIQPANNLNLYLAGGSTTDNMAYLVTVGSYIPDECLWTVTKSNPYSDRLTIKSNIGRTLCSIGSSIHAEIYPPIDDEWRAVTSVQEPSSNFPVSCEDLYITQNKALLVGNTGATFAEKGDFEYDSSSDCVTIDIVAGGSRITGVKAGTAQIKATHKPSQRTSYFNVTVRKDTIIVLPGIMGSRIFAKETINIDGNIFPIGSQLWEPDCYGVGEAPSRIRALACNNNGVPIYASGTYEPIENLNIPYDNDNIVYGTKNLYANLYLSLLNAFKNEYDVVLYEYDWRKDPYDTANELNTYINNNCGRVIFVSHSMGGLVSSYYLAKGTSQRSRVIKHISLGTPYLGSEQIPYMMITGGILGFPQDTVVANPVKDIINNLRSIYALLPPEKHFRPYVNYNAPDQTTLTYNTYSDTISGLAEKYSKWNHTIANQVSSHQSSLFDANGQHITRSVDSYYIIGDGEDTAQRSFVVTSFVADMTTVLLTDITDDCDQTVTIHSATINGNTDSNKTFYTYGVEHQGLGGGADSSNANQNKVVNFVKAIINNQVQSMSDSTLASTYNMYRTRK